MNGTRNRNGEGSVFQVAEWKWVAKICTGIQPDGKPILKQFSGKTEAVVRKKLREFKKSLEFIVGHKPNGETVKAYFTRWLRDYQYNKLKPASYDRLESTVMNHIIPNLGTLKMDKVTRDHIQQLMNQLYKKQKLSYSSVKKVYVALNAGYKHALMTDDVLKNPCVGVVLPDSKERTKQVLSLSKEEVKRIKEELAKTKNNGDPLYYYSDVFLLILNTGLRMGEALSLRWDDVDLKNRTITINKNQIMTKKRDADGNVLGGYELRTQNSTKTASGNRIVPINHSASIALQKLKMGNATPYVIVNSKDNLVLPSDLERAFHVVLRNAGVKDDYGIHVLRHTFASMLFAKSVDIKIVSQLLGHSTVKITYDTYVHVFEKDIRHMTQVLD